MKNIQEKINITELEVIETQELWAQNVIEIGNLYTKKEDYIINELNSFDKDQP